MPAWKIESWGKSMGKIMIDYLYFMEKSWENPENHGLIFNF
jgi:hypothetical protein